MLLGRLTYMASIECRNNTNGKIYRIRLPEGESVSRSRIRFGRITKQRRDLTPCFVNGCDNMRENANLDNLPLIPPRGIEPLLPG